MLVQFTPDAGVREMKGREGPRREEQRGAHFAESLPYSSDQVCIAKLDTNTQGQL